VGGAVSGKRWNTGFDNSVILAKVPKITLGQCAQACAVLPACVGFLDWIAADGERCHLLSKVQGGTATSVPSLSYVKVKGILQSSTSTTPVPELPGSDAPLPPFFPDAEFNLVVSMLCLPC
jgi:hypothetical protein